MQITSYETAKEQTRESLRNLQKLIGSTITLCRGCYTFCTEEDHNPHYWGPEYPERREEIVLNLAGVELGSLVVSGVKENGEVVTVPFMTSASSSVGSYSHWLITNILHNGRSILTLHVSQDEREGFMGMFYFWLE